VRDRDIILCCEIPTAELVVLYFRDIPSLCLEFLATDPEAWVRFPALPDFLRNSRSGTGSAQTRDYN
jgi:hypothetical protein